MKLIPSFSIKLKLVNRSNLGVSRIYRSLLVEGKEPPIDREVGSNIELTFISSSFKKGFKSIVDALIQEGKPVDVDHLLILTKQYRFVLI